MQLPQSFMNSFNAGEVPPERQAQDAILEKIGAAPETIAFDGNFHRFKIEGDKGTEKSGWYVLYGNGLPAGAFGSWRSGESFKWHAARTEPLSDAERAALEETYRRAQEQRDARIKERQARAAETCREIWDRAPAAGDDHPYLLRKKVKSHGLRVTGDGRLIMPVYIGTELSSLQYISADGQKEFHYGGKVSGGYFRIPVTAGALSQSHFVAEGYATAASIHEATGCEVWVALNAGNLTKVGQFLRENMLEADIVFVGDNDRSGTGQKAATEAAEAIKGRTIIPPDLGDANDYAADGKDLRALLLGTRRWIVPVMEFCKKPQPIRWLIKHWLQENSQMMVFGASGSGKTFIVLDMALSIACRQIEAWQGFKVKHGSVVYLAGEGYAGLRARIAGWIAHKSVEDVDMYVSEEPVDLNAPGGISRTIQEIHSYDIEPCLIVVDTLNRFMTGDENKAQDTKTMLDACAVLQREFRCSVLFVHHTGVAENAQGRARGSSAWKGAMDIEMCVSKIDGEPQLVLQQTKNKDSELQPDLLLEQRPVDVPGWLDDDGEQVRTVIIELSREVKAEMEKKLSKSQEFALQTFNEAARTVGELDADGHFAGLTREAWREVFFRMSNLDTTGAKRTAFYRAQSDLQSLGKIALQDDGTYRAAGFISKITEEGFAMSLRDICKSS